MVYHLCLSPHPLSTFVAMFAPQKTHKVFKPGIAKLFLWEATINSAKVQVMSKVHSSDVSTASNLNGPENGSLCLLQAGMLQPKPLPWWRGSTGEKPVSDPRCGEVVQWMENRLGGCRCWVLLQRIWKDRWTGGGRKKKQVGKRQMGSKWWEGLAGVGGVCEDAGGHKLRSSCLLHLLRLMAWSKAAIKAGIVSKSLPGHA